MSIDTETLFKAVREGNSIVVAKYLAEGGTVTVTSDSSRTMLQIAAGNNHTNIVDLLFSRDDLIEGDIDAALVYYAKIGNLEKVQNCINRGGKINAKHNNKTALLNAIKGKHIVVINYLLTIDGIDINAVDDLNETALIKAVFNRLLNVVDSLLAKGNVDLHIQGYLTGTALTCAIFSGQEEVAQQLLVQEETFRSQEHPGALNCAVIRESAKMVGLLITKGADINASGHEGFQEIPGDVWQMNPDEDTYPAACGRIFTTPLCCAVEQESVVMVRLLLKTHHADPNVITARRETPLILAARQGHEKIFILLMNGGTNLQQVIDGKTVETIIREDHLIQPRIKALLPTQITSYPRTFIGTIGQEVQLPEWVGNFPTEIRLGGVLLTLQPSSGPVDSDAEEKVVQLFHALSNQLSGSTKIRLAQIVQTSTELQV